MGTIAAMALMRPTEPVFEGGGSLGERRFFEALRDELPDEWTVYHQLPYYDLSHGARCGEIDFLLLHPSHGLLVVECKGRGVAYRQGEGRWYRQVDGGDPEPLSVSPVRQAERQAYDFVHFLERQLPARFPAFERFPFVFGYAVAFPLAAGFSTPHPPDLPPELVFTADDRSHLAEKAADILARRAAGLRRKPPGLPRRAFKTFRKHVLRPSFRLSAGIGGQVADDDQTFVRLTELQARVVHGLLENPVTRVRGGAGTGKTVLALEAARTLAERGDRVLLLCYNRSLGQYLRERTSRWVFERGHVTAAHFHGLCAWSHELTGQPFEPPGNGPGGDASAAPVVAEERKHFWNVEAPQVLWQAIEARRIGPFDSIVVDEGQDFESDWWTVIQDALASPDERRDAAGIPSHRPSPSPSPSLSPSATTASPSPSPSPSATTASPSPSPSATTASPSPSSPTPSAARLIVFHDPAQDLFGRQAALPAGASFRLTDNFRNTQQISELINRLGFEPLLPHPMCPVGQAPVIRPQGSPSETRKALDSLIRRLTGVEGFTPDQLTLLTPRTRPHCSLAGLETLADHPLACDPHDRAGQLLHCTVGRFKGLESDVVILLDIDPGHERSGFEVRYCGASRARHLLYVFVKGSWDAR